MRAPGAATLDSKTRRRLALGVVGLCALVAVFAPGPGGGLRSAARLHDSLHVPGFAFAAFALVLGFPAPVGATARSRAGRLLSVFGAATAVGALVEILQRLRGGDADPWDVVRDAAGAGAAVLIAASVAPGIRSASRLALRVVAVVLALAPLAPAAAALADEARARAQFPVLAAFETRAELDRFTWAPGTNGVLVRNPKAAASEARVLRVTLGGGDYPGLALQYFPRDWRGWRWLVIACANPSPSPLAVTVRIDDAAHNGEFDDRFNRAFVLAPGGDEIRIPLADVEAAPHGRKLDLSRVWTVMIFGRPAPGPRTLVIERLLLER